MKFFDRKEEIATLRKIRDRAERNAQFTVLTGRRRIGKTSLVLKAYDDQPILYFFVGRKAESLLIEEFRHEVETKLGVHLGGTPSGFGELFEYLLTLSKERSFTLFIDEFQNFEKVNVSIFSDMQKIWDLNHGESKINLIVCGSVYSMMTKIFRDEKEPLYKRQNRFMNLKAFQPSVLKEILEEYHPEYRKEDLLALYSFTGGVAKYVQLLVDDEALSKEAMIGSIISADSVFINEGRSILIEEFGRDYDIYFSILSAIASGKTKRSEIESVLNRQIGGYLTRLEEDYGIISRQIPAGAKPLSKNSIYTIKDNFLTFWFRFIFKYTNMIEIGAFSQLRDLVNRDYASFTGTMLERYYRAKSMESERYTFIGHWWDRKGENEIDMIAANELEKKVEFYEIKRNRKNIDFKLLQEKADAFQAAHHVFKGYKASIIGLDLQDM